MQAVHIECQSKNRIACLTYFLFLPVLYKNKAALFWTLNTAVMHTVSSYLQKCHGSDNIKKSMSNLDKIFNFETDAIDEPLYFKKTAYSLKQGGLVYCPGYNNAAPDILDILVSSILHPDEMTGFEKNGFENKLSYMETNMNLNVETIDIIENKKLKAMHNCFKNFSDVQGTEYAAIHATTKNNSEDIARNGFKTILCKRSQSGRGIYMANDFRICWTFGDASEHNNYTTTLILSRIYLGTNLNVGRVGESVFGDGCITLTDKNLSTLVLSDNYQALPFAVVELSFHTERYKAKCSQRQYDWATQYGSRLSENLGRLVYSISKPQTLSMLIENRQDYFQFYSNKTNNVGTIQFTSDFVHKKLEKLGQVKFLPLRHIHLDVSMAHSLSRTLQHDYYNAMKEMINEDMKHIYEKYIEVCGHGNMCVQGGRCIDIKGLNTARQMESYTTTGAVVYFWDTEELLLEDPRKRQSTIVNIQKTVLDDKMKITDEMRLVDGTIHRVWYPIDVVLRKRRGHFSDCN